MLKPRNEIAASRMIALAMKNAAATRTGPRAFGKMCDGFDRRLLRTIIEKFSGGPVGLYTISAAAGEAQDTIEEMYEPYLIQLGFLERTPRGRKATLAARRHITRGKESRTDSLF